MKKYKNITIGGIQQKIFNLVLITVILMMVVNSVVILHQSRQLSSLVEETSTAQKQSMAEISDQTMTAVQRMEDKANKMLDEAVAMAELNAQPIDEARLIEEKYRAGETASVNEELEALKKELGLAE